MILLPLLLSLAGLAWGQPASINGAYDPAFGSALSLQSAATGFGATYNQLDAAYGFIAGGKLGR